MTLPDGLLWREMAQFGKDVENITASSSIKITSTELTETFTVNKHLEVKSYHNILNWSYEKEIWERVKLNDSIHHTLI